MLSFAFNVRPVKAAPVTIRVPIDFSTIQGAVNAANAGDKIYVYNGRYYEKVIVNKTVSIFGENRFSTVVDGFGEGYVFVVTKNSVNITDLTIQDSEFGCAGVYLSSVNNCSITENEIKSNYRGVDLLLSSGNVISGNNITSNVIGIELVNSSYNRIYENDITNNGDYGIFISSHSNRFFHNNLIQNTVQVYVTASGYPNVWDDGPISGGNYWSDYAGVDVNHDGIGDPPYIIDVDNQDDYPLMEPYSPHKESTVIIGTTSPVSLDPADAVYRDVLDNIGEGLMKYKPGTSDLQYGIAESYTVSPDGLNYTFKLREGMYFTDGKLLDAAAVKWSINRTLSLAYPYEISEYVDRVEVIDTLNVRFVLKTAASFFPALVATVPYFPVSSKSYPANQTVDSTVGHYGPYKITRWIKNVELDLEANPDYYGAQPMSKYIILKSFSSSTAMKQALQEGEIDIAGRGLTATDIAYFMGNASFQVVKTNDLPMVRYITMRCNMAPFDDVRVRQAIAAAINRTKICTEFYLGTTDPLYSFVPVGLWSHIDAFEDKYGVRNLPMARTLLNLAGYNETHKLQFQFWYTPPAQTAIVNIIKSSLEETNMISVVLMNASWSTLLANAAEGLVPMFFFGSYPSYIDPDAYSRWLLHSGSSNDIGVFYANEAMDADLDEAMIQQNITIRTQLYENVQTRAANDAPLVPLCQSGLYAVARLNIQYVYALPTMSLSYYTIHKVTLSTRYPWPMFRYDLSHTGYTESPAPRTNQTLWSFNTGHYVWSSPAVASGKVYIGAYDGKVYCLDSLTGANIWSLAIGDIVRSSPAVANGRVYVGASIYIHCLDALTGVRIWNYSTGGNVYSSPVVANGKVYVGSYDNRIYCLNAVTGAHIWSFVTGGPVSSSPAVVDDRVYIGSSDGRVFCLNASTGTQKWAYTTGYSVYSSPAVADGKVYIGSYDSKIYCLDALTGAYIWSYTTGAYVWSSPAVANGKVYVGSCNHKVYCLNALTGSHVWDFTTNGEVYSSPAVADGKVYVGSVDGKVYCLDASTGARVWSYSTTSNVYSSPAVADGIVYIGSWAGIVYAIGNTIIVPPGCRTIQQIINAAPPGSTIIISPGIYYESLVINKTLTILGLTGSPGPKFDGGGFGIYMYLLPTSYGSIIAGIEITNWQIGILVSGCESCKIYDNAMYTMGKNAISLQGASAANNQIYRNSIYSNNIAINLTESSTQNVIYENTISGNKIGIKISNAIGNKIYHNSFISNDIQVDISTQLANTWDDGYPSGGNYWTGHTIVDIKRGQYQNQPDSDGINDTKYTITGNNIDNYPLTKPYGGPRDIGLTNVAISKTIIGQGLILRIDMKIINYGIQDESFAVTVYSDTSIVATQGITLAVRSSTAITFTWNTEGFVKCSYTIKIVINAVADETYVIDNANTPGIVLVTKKGDVNGDDDVNVLDLIMVAIALGTAPGDNYWNPNADVKDDADINVLDLIVVSNYLGT
jgi:peptide/nickel transport system substrate-binding protein